MGEYRDMENQLKYFWEKEPVQEDGDVVYTLGKIFSISCEGGGVGCTTFWNLACNSAIYIKCQLVPKTEVFHNILKATKVSKTLTQTTWRGIVC